MGTLTVAIPWAHTNAPVERVLLAMEFFVVKVSLTKGFISPVFLGNFEYFGEI